MRVIDQRDLKGTPTSFSSQNINSRYFLSEIWSNGLYDNVSLEISEESFFMNLDTQDFLKNTQDIPCLIRNI